MLLRRQAYESPGRTGATPGCEPPTLHALGAMEVAGRVNNLIGEKTMKVPAGRLASIIARAARVRARKLWGNDGFAHQDGSVFIVGFFETLKPEFRDRFGKQLPCAAGKGKSWEEAFEDARRQDALLQKDASRANRVVRAIDAKVLLCKPRSRTRQPDQTDLVK